MKKPGIYEIRVEGHFSEQWSDWFEGLTICNEPGGEATLTGALDDQTALMGILNRITALNITLVAVKRVLLEPPESKA
jgi:hypothetical protein